MEITTEIIKQIINDIEKEKSLVDCQKADFLSVLCYYLYEDAAEPLKKEVDMLIDKWD